MQRLQTAGVVAEAPADMQSGVGVWVHNREAIEDDSSVSGRKPNLEPPPQAACSHIFAPYVSTSAPSPRMR